MPAKPRIKVGVTHPFKDGLTIPFEQAVATKLDTTQPVPDALTVPPNEHDVATNAVARQPLLVAFTVPPFEQEAGGVENTGTRHAVPNAFADALTQTPPFTVGWIQLLVATFDVPPFVHVPFVTTGWIQPLPAAFTVPPLVQIGSILSTATTAGLPPMLALKDTAEGDSAAGTTTLAKVPAVTLNVTEVIFPAASAMVIGTVKPPQPSAM